MAGPIRISILADTRVATESVNGFANSAEQAAQRVVTGFADTKLQGSFGRMQEGFDVLDTRAMGFRDTITGVQDSLRAYEAFTTSTAEAQQRYNDAVAKYGKDSTEAMRAQEALADTQLSVYDKLLLVGTGVGDLASGFANFLVPLIAVGASMNTLSLASVKSTASLVAHNVAAAASAAASGVMTAAQWALNAAMSANPIGIVIVAIVALVAAIVLAYKNSETFRAIVQAVWAAIKAAVSAVVDWFIANIPRLWTAAQAAWSKIESAARAVWSAVQAVANAAIAAITAYINAYRAAAVAVWSAISSAASAAWNAVSSKVSAVISTVTSILSSLKDKVSSAFSGAASLLTGAGRDIVNGLVSGISGAWHWVTDKISSLVSAIPAPVRKLLGIASPSKVFAEIGKNIAQGLAVGIDDGGAQVSAAADRLVRIPLSGVNSGTAGSVQIGQRGEQGGGGPVAVQNTVLLDGEPFYAATRTAVRESERRLSWSTYAGRRFA